MKTAFPPSKEHARSTKATVSSFVGRVALFSAGVDCVYILFFLGIGSSFLAWINLVSVTMYLAAYALVQRRRLHFAVMLIWLEAFPHAAIGTMMLGWESGFHYLLLMFIPSVVMTNSQRSSRIFVVVLLVFLGSLDAASRRWGPMAAIPAESLIALKWLNITLFVAMFSALASFYRHKITQVERRLQVLASVDALTGLHNRHHFQTEAEHEMARFRRTNGSCVLIIADIDLFKQINDSFGHEAGDHVLVAAGQWLKNGLREIDTLARWGGEEFVLLMPGTELAEGLSVAERIRHTVQDGFVSHGGQEIRCTLSMGVTKMLPTDTLEGALARADRALYRSKAQGRNRVTGE